MAEVSLFDGSNSVLCHILKPCGAVNRISLESHYVNYSFQGSLNSIYSIVMIEVFKKQQKYCRKCIGIVRVGVLHKVPKLSVIV